MTYANINVMMHMHWKSLIGMKGIYEGANEQSLLFKFDNIVWKVMPDEYDGHRSCLDYVTYGNEKELITQDNLAIVKVEKDDNDTFEGYILKDINADHVWLRIGTNYEDNYYPFIVFRHFPFQKNEGTL